MKAKNVNLNMFLYIVEADKIKATKPDGVSKTESGKIKISFRYRENVEVRPDDEQVEKFYLNFRTQKGNKVKYVKR